MKRHPVIWGILLLFLLLFAFYFLVQGIASITGKRTAFSGANKIGIVDIEGIIKDSGEVVDHLNEFAKDDTVKGVILRINSPGGGVAPSQEIYDAVMELRKRKRVLASMSSVAASGGYLVACAGEKIIANSGTLTGSISAVMYFTNTEELMKKVGVKASVIKSGKYKDIGSPIREMTEEEKVLLQGLVDDIYSQFLDVVVRHRNITSETLKDIADGRIFTGRQAQKLGLVDYLGDKQYAVTMLAKLVGIEGEPVVVYPRKKYESMLDYVLQQTSSSLSAVLSTKQRFSYGIHYLMDDYDVRMMAPGNEVR
ncbi:signal peptide peptidase SppA [Syntrophus buswellii]|uniref:signal peptide peptidase SppA n=1 Tax=Syntrophus buswellii TaxID=43774 RepID=UPI0038D45F18